MRRMAAGVLSVAAAALFLIVTGHAQDHPSTTDPRVGLKPGFENAGQAAKNLQLVAHMGKPQGFFNPDSPAGTPTPPERSDNAPAAPAAQTTTAAPQTAAPTADAQRGAAPANGGGRGGPSGLDFANSDVAFRRADMFVGNFNGFNSYDIETPRRPRLMTSVVCPGGQGDMSVRGNLLFMSVEQTRGRVDCGTQGVTDVASKDRFRGVRIFDISDINHPRQVAAVQTCRGSHTHTIVDDPNDKANLYIYGSGTSTVRPGEELAGCSSAKPEEDPNTSLFSIDVIKVPLAHPEQAAIVNRPRIFADEKTGAIAGLQKGGDRGPDAQPARETNQCHDITVFPAVGLAAGACSGNGILLDISDPVHPKRLDAAADKNFAYWHSATFNNDGTKVIFTDEWGGGTRPRCRAEDPLNWGADAIFDIVDKKLVFRSYYKMPAAQTEQENCVAHNGSLIPVPGRDIMVQGWYQGGLSVFDFTDSAHPVEIAYFDRGPIDATQLITGGYWSGYWYNGHIYGSEIARGIDIFRLIPSQFLTQNEIDAAAAIHSDEFNPQEQPKQTWPASPVVARAYLDQLNRDKALPETRTASIKSALDRAEKGKTPAVTKELTTLATGLTESAASASGRDAQRMNALAETLKKLASQ
jgi:hypothetical protein